MGYLVNGGNPPTKPKGYTMGTTTKGNTTNGNTTTKGTPTKGNKGSKGTKGTPTQCTFVKPTPVTPQVRKGTSTVPNPVGVTWVTCVNTTIQHKNTLQKRSVYHQTCIKVGVTYYTVRTQVHLYLLWVKGGSNPNQLPRGVVLPKGYKQPKG